MKITGYECDNGKVTAITVTDETRGFYDKRFEEERPHGKWIKHENGDFHCTNCGFEIDTYIATVFFNFCPNCGALMDGKDGKNERD